MKFKKGSLFTRLLFVFFSSGVAIIVSIILSFHFLSDKPHKKRVLDNLRVYSKLLIEKYESGEYEYLKEADIEIQSSVIEEQREFEEINFKGIKFDDMGGGLAKNKKANPFVIRLTQGNRCWYISSKVQNDFSSHRIVLLSSLILSLLILIFLWRSVRKLFKPIEEIEHAAKMFGEGNLNHSIEERGKTELDSLAESINIMKENIKQMLESKHELLLAIAHELKTPLSRMRLHLELMENEDRKTQLIHEVDEINNIIESLIESERMEFHQSLNATKTNLSELLSSFKSDRVSLLTEEKLEVRVDPVKFKLAISNLINNSLKYSDKEVEVSYSKKSEKTEIVIKDYGTGIPEENLEKITEAFYRPDEHRSREVGGVGLGLYLVKKIIMIHGGELRFENTKPGLEVTIIL